ncbi:EVE domain-containing protein [Chryseosolibacter indicus]|uniref:EVE domain-containing protein n=1 Tax=Chryseosolibacter indicus TaxID=2782351 RepID=A0ABS5VMQ2_9BACT|nr:EVE domain-containing protein [Chryseosolibacter indicus]MBT1702729.1 EVE domain-containing protein [Chryseosolibacter indicus]
MNYWLVKTEPDTFSWDDLVRDKKTVWDGVRNFQARSHLKAMEQGDLVFIYHTGDEKAIIGISTVLKAGYPEPADNEWIAVDLAPKQKLKNPVTLAQIKSDKRLSNMVLVRASRLSVQPVRPEEFDIVVALSEEK